MFDVKLSVYLRGYLLHNTMCTEKLWLKQYFLYRKYKTNVDELYSFHHQPNTNTWFILFSLCFSKMVPLRFKVSFLRAFEMFSLDG